MPNWYSDSGAFLADAEKLQQIRGLFSEIQAKQKAGENWHLPDFSTAENGFMLDIILDKHSINFEPRFFSIDAINQPDFLISTVNNQ
jgi:hypothetical protein